ncbi:MAG: hypothetical protein PHF37_00160 [Phycisphaerae bacterium]|nr:hypothetical protein [Phycisphaerae bacterium]
MMKKLSLILAVLLLVPAMATVTLTIVDEGSGVARIDYTADANVSAFALDVSVSAGTITAVSDYKTDGESVTGSKGYGIYPGSITIVGDAMTDSGTPHVGGDPCLPASSVILEMGALYGPGDANRPDLSGTLCKLTVSANCTMSITENALRGGIVYADATGADLTTDPTTGVITLATPPAAPTNVAATDGTGTTTITVSWTASVDATSYDVYKSFTNDSGTATLAGNIAASPYVYSAGTTQTNADSRTTYFWVKAKNIVGDSGFSAGDAGYVTEFMQNPSTPAAEYTAWVTWGRPKCWGYRKQCNGDTNGTSLGGKPVTNSDVTLIATAFNKDDAALALVVNGICADLNHATLGGKRVTNIDVTTLATNFNKDAGLVAECVNSDILFWKN